MSEETTNTNTTTTILGGSTRQAVEEKRLEYQKFQEKLDEISECFTTVNEQMDDLKTQIDDLKTQGADTKAEYVVLFKATEDLKKAIESLQGDKDAVSQEMTASTKDLSLKIEEYKKLPKTATDTDVIIGGAIAGAIFLLLFYVIGHFTKGVDYSERVHFNDSFGYVYEDNVKTNQINPRYFIFYDDNDATAKSKIEAAKKDREKARTNNAK